MRNHLAKVDGGTIRVKIKTANSMDISTYSLQSTGV